MKCADIACVIAILFVARNVLPSAVNTGNVPEAAPFAFMVGCAPLLYIALVAYKLFGCIGNDETFTSANARSLKVISIASAISASIWAIFIILCALVTPYGSTFAMYASLSVALIFTFTLAMVSFALAILTERASDIKSENDMTV
ncbi:MAG: DUF2975 domain-containing protein [Atopobiaceae bacterium]